LSNIVVNSENDLFESSVQPAAGNRSNLSRTAKGRAVEKLVVDDEWESSSDTSSEVEDGHESSEKSIPTRRYVLSITWTLVGDILNDTLNHARHLRCGRCFVSFDCITLNPF